MSIVFDDKAFQSDMKKLPAKAKSFAFQGILDIGNELLRLSQIQVPLREGTLQNSGNVQEHVNIDEVWVGYHTPYAARLHEHPEYRFRNNRKGKYLEDPLKLNTHVFQEYFTNRMGEMFK